MAEGGGEHGSILRNLWSYEYRECVYSVELHLTCFSDL